MNLEQSIAEIKERYQEVMVRVATPYSTGTGFYLKDHNLIVTSEYVVRDNREVIVEGRNLDKQMVPVVFSDTLNDLAFLQPPELLDMPAVAIGQSSQIAVGDWVMAIGHPFGLPFLVMEGEVKNCDYQYQGQSFLEIDAHLQPGNVGGPVVNQQGEVIGINTFLVRKEDKIDFALPVNQLVDLIAAFQKADRQPGGRCDTCENICFAPLKSNGKCNHCGSKIVLPPELPIFEPAGIGRTIEQLISEIGHRAPLARRGPNTWEIKEGSAHVNISYYEKNGLIIGDAYLCVLPPHEDKLLLEYLLKQNHEIEGLTFSIRHQNVVLSLLIYDRYFNKDTGAKLFRYLFETADYHDNILIEEFGASWRHIED